MSTPPVGKRRPGRGSAGAPIVAAPVDPVAQVAVDTPLAHLDRPFDYLVPDSAHDACQPGVRVRVRFAGRLVDGFVLARCAASSHGGTLSPLTVLSPEPVLHPEVAALARAVADRYAGTLSDVLRLAVPPRSARVEKEPGAAPTDDLGADSGPPRPAEHAHGLDRYVAGPAFLAGLAAGRSPRAVWSALPGPGWPDEVAAAVAATRASGRGVLIVVPGARETGRVAAAVPDALVLAADIGPAERYRRFLAVSRGQAKVVVGTRGAVFAPVHALGLIVVWDDGNDLYAEPRAPYPHARDVAVLRAHRQGAALLVGGHWLSADAAALIESNWARPLRPSRAVLRATAPAVVAAGSDTELARDEAARAARLPTLAWRTAADALAGRGNQAPGPVLVQVPRRGYLPALACARCRTPARCVHCSGPLNLPGPRAQPSCSWCGRPAVAWTCPVCGHDRLRAGRVGERRTAEELGRAFPGVPVRTSGGDTVLAHVPGDPAVVVATPGAEPAADGPGYAAVLLLDAWSLLGRPELRAGEEALRRWANAAALARPLAPVVLTADGSLPAVQALIRWDPAGAAARELADRAALGFPPARRMAALDGAPAALAALLAAAALPTGAEVLGPVPRPLPGHPDAERVLIRVPAGGGAALSAALKAASAVRTARKDPDPVRIQVDPQVLD